MRDHTADKCGMHSYTVAVRPLLRKCVQFLEAVRSSVIINAICKLWWRLPLGSTGDDPDVDMYTGVHSTGGTVPFTGVYMSASLHATSKP